MKAQPRIGRVRRCLLASALLAAPIGAGWAVSSAAPASAGSLVCYTGPYINNTTVVPQGAISATVALGGNIFGGTYHQDATGGGGSVTAFVFTQAWYGIYGETLTARFDVPPGSPNFTTKGWLLVAYAC
jgi:hypothetical protein